MSRKRIKGVGDVSKIQNGCRVAHVATKDHVASASAVIEESQLAARPCTLVTHGFARVAQAPI